MVNYTKLMDELMENEVNTGYVVGNSALIICNGKEVYNSAFGYADRENKVPMKRDTIIRLFSMTKPITAVASMKAMELGLIDFTDPVSKYLPEYKDMKKYDESGNIVPVYNQITLMNLLTMTSGIPYGENWEGASRSGEAMQKLFDELIDAQNKGQRLPTREWVKRFAEIPLVFEPGERWMYGLSADVMAAVIEVASGMRYGEFLRKHIFVPLNMKDTGFYVPKEKWDRFAMSYDMSWAPFDPYKLTACDDCHLGEYYHEDISFEAGGCGLVSTLDDYSRFAQMLANGGIYNGQRIISSASVKFMSQNHLDDKQIKPMDWESTRGYGYGCLVRVHLNQTKSGSQAPVGEYGWDGWTGNYVAIDPVNNMVILYFIQKRGAGTTPVVRKLRAVTYGAIDYISE